MASGGDHPEMTELDSNDVEALKQQQRKEKKELQARVQAMKQTVNKNKKQKKDMLAEISKLTEELEMKHKMELLKLTTETRDDGGGDTADVAAGDQEGSNTPHGDVEPKLTKAQKRRNKKEEERRERQARICDAEKEHEFGARRLESDKINQLLRDRRLKVYEVGADGNCLYNAVGHQSGHTAADLRRMASEYIRRHKDDFRPYMTTDNTDGLLPDTDFDSYCSQVSKDGTWGGYLELRALSQALGRTIQVVQAEGDHTVTFGDEQEGATLTVTYHRHVVSSGEHYNSVSPLDDNPDDDWK